MGMDADGAPEESGRWAAGLRASRAEAQRAGAEFYVLFGPLAETIYPEKLPTWVPAQRRSTGVDSILSAVDVDAARSVLDVRGILLRNKEAQFPVYSPFETHWTGYGAYLAYVELIDRIRERQPWIGRALQLERFERATLAPDYEPGNLALMLGIASFVDVRFPVFKPPAHPERRVERLSSVRTDWSAPTVVTTGTRNGRTLLLVRDSFSLMLSPLLEPHFERLVMSHLEDGFFRPDLISRYRPDVIVTEVIESGLKFVMQPREDKSLD